MKKPYLDTEQKLKLIEILLIVGSILIAFNQSTISILFPLFLVFAVAYYIALQGRATNAFISYIFSGLIAICFVGTISFILGQSLQKSFENPMLSLFIKWLYYLSLSLLIFIALVKGSRSN